MLFTTSARFNLVEVKHELVSGEAAIITKDYVTKASNSEQEDVSAGLIFFLYRNNIILFI